MRIKHSYAIKLEHQVRRLYKCDRAGVAGLCDADNFEENPIDAAKLVVAYVHARGLQSSETRYDELLHKYETEFENATQDDVDDLAERYVDELKQTVDLFAKPTD